jgi:cytochrome c biogenesis protein CcmG/thiol:disulfide interchange protein DsbE
MKRFLLPLGVFLILAAFLAIGLTLDPSKVPSPLIGKPAPAFSAPRLHAPDQVITREDLLGRVVLVNVWASWCTACREEHPVLMALADHYRVPVYGLNYKDRREDALAWLAELGDSYTAIIHDPKGEVGLEWGVYGVPETFVLDAQGIIRRKYIGALTPDILNNELLPLIEQLEQEATAQPQE